MSRPAKPQMHSTGFQLHSQYYSASLTDNNSQGCSKRENNAPISDYMNGEDYIRDKLHKITCTFFTLPWGGENGNNPVVSTASIEKCTLGLKDGIEICTQFDL